MIGLFRLQVRIRYVSCLILGEAAMIIKALDDRRMRVRRSIHGTTTKAMATVNGEFTSEAFLYTRIDKNIGMFVMRDIALIKNAIRLTRFSCLVSCRAVDM